MKNRAISFVNFRNLFSSKYAGGRKDRSDSLANSAALFGKLRCGRQGLRTGFVKAMPVAVALLVGCVSPAVAQTAETESVLPVISIEAVFPQATEGTGGAVFYVDRSGSTDKRLVVTLRSTVGPSDPGTASDVVFESGVTTALFDFLDDDDNVYQDSRTLTVRIAASALWEVSSTQGSATMTILDDDEPVWSVEALPPSIGEAGGSSVVAISTGGVVLEEAQTIALAFDGGTATPGAEFTVSAREVTLDAGESYEATVVTAVDDAVVDGDKTVRITASIDGVAIGSDELTIVDNDVSVADSEAFEILDASAEEGAGEIEFTVRRAAAESLPAVILGWATRDDTALAGSDYEASSRSLVFAEGETEKTIRVVLLDDSSVETAETFLVLLDNRPDFAPLKRAEAVGLIEDDDAAGSISVAAVRDRATEGDTVSFVFTRSGGQAAVDVDVQVSGLSKVMSAATRALRDRASGSGADTTVSIGAGENSATLNLTTDNDNRNEGDGFLRVELLESADASYTVDGSGSATTLVEDDDIPTVTVRVADAVTASLRGGALEGAVIEGTSLGYEVVCPTEYELAWPVYPVRHTRVMNHPYRPGHDTDISLVVRCEDNFESHAAVSRHFTGPDNGVSTFAVQTLAEYVATATVGPFLLDYEAVECDLEENIQYCPKYRIGTPGRVRMTIVNRDPTITIEAVGDAVDEGEPAEFILRRIWNAENLYDELQGTTTVSVRATAQGDYVAQENLSGLQSVVFRPGEAQVTVQLATVRDGAHGADGSVAVELLADSSGNGNVGASYETYDFLPGITPAGGSSNVANVRIRNTDSEGFEILDASAEEGDGAIEFTVRRAAAEALPAVTLGWITTDDTALAGSDYESSSGSLNFAEGETEKTVQVVLLDDTSIEPAETFVVLLDSGPDIATLKRPAAIGLIEDDDAVGSVSVTAVRDRATEGDTVSFVFTRSGGHAAVDVDVKVSGLSKVMSAATLALRDRASGSGADTTVSIGAGENSATLNLTTDNDNRNEGDGFLRVDLLESAEAPYTLSGSGNATTLVEDDDIPTVTVRVADSVTASIRGDALEGAVIEGTSLGYEVVCPTEYELAWPVYPVRHTRVMNHPYNPEHDTDISLLYRCDNSFGGHAAANRHFTGPDNGVSTFAVQTLSEYAVTGTVAPFLLSEGNFEPGDCDLDENVQYCPKYRIGTPGRVRMTIVNRDPTITIEAVDDAVDEGEPVDFVLRRIWNAENLHDELQGATTVSIRATAEGDYVSHELLSTVQELRFQRGEAQINARFSTAADGEVGEDGSLAIELLPENAGNANVGASYEIYDFLPGITPAGGSSSMASVRIRNTDSEGFEILDASAEEGTGAIEFTVRRAASGLLPAVTLGWTTTDDTALAGSDYESSGGSLTFAEGETEKTIRVVLLDDALVEPAETFLVTLDNVPDGVAVRRDTAVGLIENDDVLTAVVTADAAEVLEGSSATFTVSLTGGTGSADVAVAYTVNGTATGGADYTAPSGSLTIAAGRSSGTISIQTTADSVLDPGETVIVTLTGASTAAGTATHDATPATTTITDGGMETVSVASTAASTAEEGDDIEFKVALSGAASSDTVLSWSTLGRHGDVRRRLHADDLGDADHFGRRHLGHARGVDGGRRPGRSRRDLHGHDRRHDAA